MKRVWLSLTMLLFLMGFAIASESVLVLITDEEAKQLQSIEETSYGFASSETIRNDGPEIEVILPKPNEEYKPPLTIDIRFIPKEGSEIDISSLRVEVEKSVIIRKDITSRVLPYTTKSGIKAENVKIPSGKYKFRLTLADTLQRVTEKVFIVKVI